MIRETCHCGHDKSTHFEDAHTCLGMRCDCRAYRDCTKPDPADVPRDPRHGEVFYRGRGYAPCGCYDCKRYRERTAPR